MDWVTITGAERFYYGGATQPGIWGIAPEMGSVPVRQRRTLAAILADHTETPEQCWFAVWEGFGDAPFPTDGFPKLQMPHRPMVLFRGPLDAATTSFASWWRDQSASL
jgi:hypothetical protein